MESHNSQNIIIQVKDLHFSWNKKDGDVLDIEELSVRSGEHLFIKGPSGSGKTTLLNLFAGIVSPTSGTVEVMDTELSRLAGPERDAFRVAHIGFVFQLFNLIPYLSLIENVILPGQFSRVRLCRVTEKGTDLADEAERLLLNLGLKTDDFASRSVNQLSVGQQQRVAVARALIGSPEIIICDEPTSSLDTDNQRAFLDLLFQEVKKAGSTLIFVSHDNNLSYGFDRTIDLTAINQARSNEEYLS